MPIDPRRRIRRLPTGATWRLIAEELMGSLLRRRCAKSETPITREFVGVSGVVWVLSEFASHATDAPAPDPHRRWHERPPSHFDA